MQTVLGMSGVDSYAKVNLFLEVTGKRPDGYHDIDSVFVEVALPDTLYAEKTDAPDIVLECSDASLPTDGRNLVVRAAEAIRRRCGVKSGLRLMLEKTVPQGAGLGGGSANAAAALCLANDLWETGLGEEALLELAAEIGSDVPFFVRGGTCRCRGRGEVIERLPDFPDDIFLILALSGIHSDTAAAYRGLRLPGPEGRRDAGPFLDAMAAGDVAAMEAAAFNRFEESVFAALPELGRLRDELSALCGRPVRMSGSGSGLWYFADSMHVLTLRKNPDLTAWAAQNGVSLVVAESVPSTATGWD